MTIGSISSAGIGWSAIATGAAAILAVIFLALMYAGKPAFGRLNDVFNSLIGIFSVVLAYMLYVEFPAKAPVLSQIPLRLVALGAIFTLIGSFLVMSGSTGFVLAGWYTGIGNALIGLWLSLFCLTMQGGEQLPYSLVRFGIITGGFMVFGLIGIFGIVAKADSLESMPKYLYVAFFSYLGTYILYPIWAILLGRYLLLK